MAFLSKSGMYRLGITNFGNNVLISDKCSIYGTDISIGNNVRIDDFCILSGNIVLGNNIHIGAYSALYGKYGIIMEDYTGLSPRCIIFSATDDFGGDYLISPMNPPEYTNVTGGPVVLEKFVQLGANVIVMPNLTLSTGAVIGAMSFVKRDIGYFQMWAGNPLRFIRTRSNGLVHLANKLTYIK